MILVTLTLFSNSAFSELCSLSQWGFLHQTYIDTLLETEKSSLDFNDPDLIFMVTTALCNFKV